MSSYSTDGQATQAIGKMCPFSLGELRVNTLKAIGKKSDWMFEKRSRLFECKGISVCAEGQDRLWDSSGEARADCSSIEIFRFRVQGMKFL
jgi:hypothetical protein